MAVQDTTDSLDERLSSQVLVFHPTFTRTVSGIPKNMVGLDQVDNTSDADKPLTNAMKEIIAKVGSDTRLYVNTGNTFLIQDATGYNPIATFNKTLSI